jgi:hypothetical protein
MVNPRLMCRRHLLGEHVECHMFAGTIKRGIGVKGYLDKGLLEIHNLQSRHDKLAGEMERRGYRHKSPLESPSNIKAGKVNRMRSRSELSSRCAECSRLSSRGARINALR